MPSTTFWGYRRANGTVGTRNHVIILPVDDLSNAAAETLSHMIQGTMAIPHPYGRLQFGEDLDLTFRTLIGAGANPNVAAVVVLCIEPKWGKLVADGIAKTGKPVASFAIEDAGDIGTIAAAAKTLREFVLDASELKREWLPVSDAVFSVKCGESDTTSGLASNPAVGSAVEWLVEQGATVIFGETSEITGAEHIIAARFQTDAGREKYLRMHQSYQDLIIQSGADLLGSQPTQGNIKGGLTTIEEKALGNIQKIGNLTIADAIEPAVTPPGKGLYFMDSSSAAAEMVTLCAAAGSMFHFFTTGQGNIIGNAIIPVLKTTANPKTANIMSDHIDVDISGMLTRELSLKSAGEKLLDMMTRIAGGRMSCSEALGHKEFVLTKLYRSA